MRVSIKEMMDAGVHFGHQTERWNPRIKPYVHSTKDGIHIIDLQKTVVATKVALDFVKDIASQGKRMIFVGTKKQSVKVIKEAALSCGQFYVIKRWLGGTITNFVTIKASIDRLRKLEIMKEKGEFEHLSKKEMASVTKEFDRLEEYLSGIRDMKEPPGAVFVVDLKKEHIAVAESNKVGIPVIAIADTNTDPGQVPYPIPGNDDAIRSIKLFSNLIAEAYNEGSKIWDKQKAMVETEEKVEKKVEKSGPTVMKMSRRLVAAGTADDVEIKLELDKEKTEPSDTESDDLNNQDTDKDKEKEKGKDKEKDS